jgi:anaerobic selenocysteine-containing dehydrogenase
VLYGPKLVEAPGEAMPNFWVHNELLRRLGETEDPALNMTDREVVAETLRRSGYGELDEIEKTAFVERAFDHERQHFAEGFAWPDGKFRFKPNWQGAADKKNYTWVCDPSEMPAWPDYWDVNEPVDDSHPFRMATSPARSFLNSSFSETPGSKKRAGDPSLLIHPVDASALGVAEGSMLRVGNRRGEVVLKASVFDGIQRGVVIAEGIHPNSAHANGRGINTLIGSDPVKPFGGVGFHDCAVWVRPDRVG